MLIYIGIGSNLGNRLQNLQMAVDLLRKRCLRDLKCSIVLETEAILPAGAPKEWNRPYLNMVVAGESSLPIQELLKTLKAIECEIGRPENYEKWSPRIIDLDILFSDEPIEAEILTIPHKELLNRPFLVHLMAILNPLLDYPGLQRNFNEIATAHEKIENCFTNSFVIDPCFVGIVNITPDSFSDGGLYFKPERALERVDQLLQAGASVIEIGAQSTRRGAKMLTAQEELHRLVPVFDGLVTGFKDDDLCISLDSFQPEVILEMLKRYRVAWVNDQAGNLDEKTLKKIADHGCHLCAMHALDIPTTRNFLPLRSSPNKLVAEWGKEVIKRLENNGFSKDKIILDPGIGFGKSYYQNLSLLRDVTELKALGSKVLIGHSRKSYMASFTKSDIQDRDLETIAMSQHLSTLKVDYLRVHNVRDHQRFFVAQQVMSPSAHFKHD